jgi:phosphate transport system protein
VETVQTRHTNIQYEAELTQLRAALLEMGALVQAQIAAAIEALVNRDTAQARNTIARDAEVNRMDVEIDERCIRLLALYQPSAGDLRFITTGLKITTDLERIGDNAVNICERIVEINKAPKAAPYARIPRLAEVAQAMVRGSLDAFLRGDDELAEATIKRDDEADRLADEIATELLAHMAENPGTIAHGTGILFVLKHLERIADHATNIAEMVVFMVKGKLIRHMDKNRKP